MNTKQSHSTCFDDVYGLNVLATLCLCRTLGIILFFKLSNKTMLEFLDESFIKKKPVWGKLCAKINC